MTAVRDGKVRCKGAFQHPILAGCYFAALVSLVPMLFTGLTARIRHRGLAVVGMVSAFVIVICSASSTPLVGMVAGMGALCLYCFRREVPYIRWAVVLGLIGLHLVMKQPVWHILARIDLTGSSTGYHRFLLIDSTIRRFSEWALVGVESTADWGYFLFDVTGHFVLQCTNGGLLSFILFVAVLFLAFRGVGRVARLQESDRRRQMAIWMVGAALFAHCVNFLGVSYFGKPLLLWHLNLAVVGSMVAGHEAVLAAARVRTGSFPPPIPGVVPTAAGEPAHGR